MYNYEKSLVTTIFSLAVFATWQLLKTVFYRLPKALARLGTHNN